VCAVFGKVPVANKTTWLQAQDTAPECQAIANAFGMVGGIQLASFTYACLEDTPGNHVNNALNGQLYCSNYDGCPMEHLTNMDQLGITCADQGSARRSICPCQ